MKKSLIVSLGIIMYLVASMPMSLSAQQPQPKDSTIILDTVGVNVINPTIDTTSQAKDRTRITPIENIKNTSLYNIISTKKIVWAVFVLVIAYFGIRLFIRLLTLISERSTRYRITVKGLIPLFRVLSWTAVTLFIIAGIFKPSMATLIAFSASVGVAVGFASQDILKNIFGGIVIIFDQPFKVGDKIEIGNYYGEVLEIGLRSTRLVTPDDSIVAVPNAEIMNQSVSNANSGELNCQVVAEFFLPLDIDTIFVRQLAIEAAQVSKYIYLNKPITVLFFQEIKEKRTYYKMKLKAYVMDIRYEFAFRSDLTEILIGVLMKEGILTKDFEAV